MFNLTSDFEGFPNVLLESVYLGTKFVSHPAQFGPIEITREIGGGIILNTDDTKAVVEELINGLSYPAVDSWHLLYSKEAVTNKFQEILEQC